MSPPRTPWIHGPIVSSSDLDSHERLFAAFGMESLERRAISADACSRQWGTAPGTTATELLMATPGSPYGARILQFDPLSPVVIRDRQRGYDADAPKVIDFYTPDFPAACAAVKRAGFAIKGPVAEYDLPEGHFRETHVWGPDEFVCALITGPAEFFRNFATITDRLFSEPQSLSGPVTDLDAAEGFFRRVFGFTVVHAYEIEDQSFKALVGSERPQFRLRARNLGTRTEVPYLGLIHYGMPEGSYASLAGRARPPNRGIVGATIFVYDVDAVVRTAQSSGGTALTAVTAGEAGTLGVGRSALILAPNGGCYQVISAG